jgi:hypothetical protein
MQGLATAQREFILPLDADDKIALNYIELIHAMFFK